MTATIKAAMFPFAQAKTGFDSNPVSGITEDFRKLSRYMPVIVLVPKSAVHDKTTQKKPGPNKSVTGLNGKRLRGPGNRTPPLSSIHPRMDWPGASPFSGFIGAWFTAVRTEAHVGRPVNEGSLRPRKFEVQPTPTTGGLFTSVAVGLLESREADTPGRRITRIQSASGSRGNRRGDPANNERNDHGLEERSSVRK
jgi:hypothetical protein